MLPASYKEKISDQLKTDISEITAVAGGDINQAAKLTTRSGESFFVKWNNTAPAGMFETEAKGLKLLKSAGTKLTVPEVFLASEQFLVLEWISEQKESSFSAELFGTELAKLHRTTDTQFGLDYDNFIGRLPQSNTPHFTWPDFFTIERIEPQIKMGVESGKLSRITLRNAEHLYKKLGAIFPTEEPALIHGDLWSGNYMYIENGVAIFDPALYYGHREMELAMTKLFGGFPAKFYSAYEEEFPLSPGLNERIKVYNLYPILVHANLFGGSYCRQAEEIINHFAR